MSELSLGEKRTAINFSEQQPGNVFFLKEAVAKIINVLESYRADPRNNITEDMSRKISIAQIVFEKALDVGISAVNYENEEKELVSFGNYLLSEGRENLLKNAGHLNDETMREVHHSDLKNWKDHINQK